MNAPGTPADGPGIVLTAGPSPGDWGRASEAFRAFDDLGCSALWLTDHLFWGRPMPEALTMAAVAAAATDRCTVGTGVLQLPLRRTAAVAKAATTIQVLSGGRFVLGVGVGEHEAEYERSGAPFGTRGRDLDRAVAELRSLWTEDAGDTWLAQRPRPSTIPVWVGGRSEAAIARAAATADGWMPIFVDHSQYRRSLLRLTAAIEASARPDRSVTRAVTLIAAVTDGPSGRSRALEWCSALWDLPPDRLERFVVTGPPAQVSEAVDAHRDAGSTHVALLLATDEPLDMFARLV